MDVTGYKLKLPSKVYCVSAFFQKSFNDPSVTEWLSSLSGFARLLHFRSQTLHNGAVGKRKKVKKREGPAGKAVGY